LVSPLLVARNTVLYVKTSLELYCTCQCSGYQYQEQTKRYQRRHRISGRPVNVTDLLTVSNERRYGERARSQTIARVSLRYVDQTNLIGEVPSLSQIKDILYIESLVAFANRDSMFPSSLCQSSDTGTPPLPQCTHYDYSYLHKSRAWSLPPS
jgi:hypothetical protein